MDLQSGHRDDKIGSAELRKQLSELAVDLTRWKAKAERAENDTAAEERKRKQVTIASALPPRLSTSSGVPIVDESLLG